MDKIPCKIFEKCGKNIDPKIVSIKNKKILNLFSNGENPI
jgi:hypothetical protein